MTPGSSERANIRKLTGIDGLRTWHFGFVHARAADYIPFLVFNRGFKTIFTSGEKSKGRLAVDLRAPITPQVLQREGLA